MIRYDEVKDKIDNYTSSGEWGKILDLISCKDSINSDIDDELKSKLYYYYANIIEDVAGINKAELFIKYYDLFNLAKTVAFKNLQDKESRNMMLRTIAYFYKTIYESRLWSPKIFRNYPKEIQDKLSSDGYTSTYFRDSALYFYYLCLNRDSNDIKTNYRYAHLLRKLIQHARQNNKRDKNNKLMPIDYTKSLREHLSSQALSLYTNYLNKNKISIMHTFPPIDLDILYYNKTIKLWETCTDKKEKDRTMSEYLKALYAFCRHYVDNMDALNISIAGLDYNIINDFSRIVDKNIQYNSQRKTLSMADSVNDKLKTIFKILKFPVTAEGLNNPHFIKDKLPIQTNYFYYTLAKYYITYGVNYGGREDDLRAALKASYFSVLANYNMSTIPDRTKSVNKWPYVLFAKLLDALKLSEEIDIFQRKFGKGISYKDKQYLTTLHKIAVLFDQGKYFEAKKIGISYIRNNKVSYADKIIIQKMIDRANAFINDPNIIAKNKIDKAKQILAKNTLTAIGFYKL